MDSIYNVREFNKTTTNIPKFYKKIKEMDNLICVVPFSIIYLSQLSINYFCFLINNKIIRIKSNNIINLIVKNEILREILFEDKQSMDNFICILKNNGFRENNSNSENLYLKYISLR